MCDLLDYIIHKRIRNIMKFILLVLLLLTNLTYAADYPSRPVRIIIPLPIGSSTDIASRILIRYLEVELKHKIIAHNRTGAGSIVGTDVAAKSTPDGYTLLIVGSSFSTNPAINKTLPFYPVHDFSPVVKMLDQLHMVVVHPSLPVNTTQNFLHYLKSHRGAVNLGHSGIGTSSHLAAELCVYMSGTKMLLVPYIGGGAALHALLQKEVDVNLATVAVALPHVKNKQLLAIATTGVKRSLILPEVPTLDESGLKGFDFRAWMGVLVPSRVPLSIINKLENAITDTLRQESLQQEFLQLGLEVDIKRRDAFTLEIVNDINKWKKLVSTLNISNDVR